MIPTIEILKEYAHLLPILNNSVQPDCKTTAKNIKKHFPEFKTSKQGHNVTVCNADNKMIAIIRLS